MSEINTWIFQGNPQLFDVDTYIQNYKYIWWSVRQKHLLDKIKLGDQVFLWRSDGGKKGTGRILAQTRIVSLPQKSPNEESASDYWHTEDRADSYLAVKLEVLDVRFLEGFISRLSLLEHPVLKDLLILRQRTQTNYLLSTQHAVELQNLWSSDTHSILVRSHSWKVLGKSVAIKELDKSTFLHHGTGIPQEVRGFFNAVDMKRGERRNLLLQYGQRVYQARLEMDKHSSPRSRLLWKADFSEVIRNQFPQLYSHFLSKDYEVLSSFAKLKLEKVESSLDTYLVEFLSLIDSEILIEDSGSAETELYETRVEETAVTHYGKRYECDAMNQKRTILQPGQILSNGQIAATFKCSNQGGMRRSHTTNTLVIISDHTKLHKDRKEGGIFHYTGMGRKGDQSLSFAQNKTLAQSNINGIDVFLFEVVKPTEYIFVGQVVLADEPYQEEQDDEDGKLRNVWIFPLIVREKEPSFIDEIATISAVFEENNEITGTEREQIIKSRIGQSTFKKALLNNDKKCKLCGVSDEQFLIASHIKPWSQSSNQERLDVNNGLLLCPNHDALFDKGYISFGHEGEIMISDCLDEATKVFLNINENMNIKMNEKQQLYIKWHRENIFN